MLFYAILGLLCGGALVVFVWQKLYPKPYPGIPYNKASAQRITGDIPDLIPVIKSKNEFSESIFTVTTRKLGTPVAQLLFPGFRKPFVILEDPREIEDIIVRRNAEFDRSPTAVDLFAPMFAHSSIVQYATPELKAQKHLWAGVMSPNFLRRAAAPNIYDASLELVELWKLKASTLYKGQPFLVYDDLKNSALEAIWVALIGEKPGITKYEFRKLQCQVEGSGKGPGEAARGAAIKEEVNYISETVARNSNSASPKWAQKLETYTPRYRKFRARVTAEIGEAMRRAVDRFQRLDLGKLDADELDTCMMDLVLRRQMLQDRKAGRTPRDPMRDQNMLDEMFIFLVGGYDSTANALAWLVKFMEAWPAVQTELREVLQAAFPGPGQPSVEDILRTDIPYLDGVCEESSRLAGVAKASMRWSTVDTEILGYRIPKGTTVFMNFHMNRPPLPVDESKRAPSSRSAASKVGDGLQTDAGRHLERFEPRRWLVKDDVSGKESFNAYALPALGFSGGYRGCFGKRFAQMEFRILVVLLILNFEFLPLPEECRSMNAHEKIFREPDKPYAKLRVLR